MRTTDANVEMMVGLARILNKHAIPIHPLAARAGLSSTHLHYSLPNGGCCRKLGIGEYKAILDAVAGWRRRWMCGGAG